MKQRTEADREVAVLHPEGRLAGEGAAALRKEAREVLGSGRHVVLDLAGVKFTDSEGLSALVSLYRTAMENSKAVALCSLPRNLRSLLELTRLHRVFDIYENEALAVSAIRAGSAG